MSRINFANIKKTIYYVKRNGILQGFYAASERIKDKEEKEYQYFPPSSETLKAQRNRIWESSPTISIVVPLYSTPHIFLRALIESVMKQTYAKWELVLFDASPETENLQDVVAEYTDSRICYRRHPINKGISQNTNEALCHATGDYIGLLDHDDLLTADALYEMADEIVRSNKQGIEKQLLFSDEDKCDMNGTYFFEHHRKEDFNFDLLLSNNYVCHFMVMKSELIKSLNLRKEYEGAQDFDLVLRAVGKILPKEEVIGHIPKVLYHWRCHEGSTAENPQSKAYAYEAGLKAVQEFVSSQGWNQNGLSAEVGYLKHLGFYGITYEPELFKCRKDIAAVGGRMITKNKIAGGIYGKDGNILYHGLHKRYSGYMHKGALMQDAEAVDIRFIKVRLECRALFREVTGVEYVTKAAEDWFDVEQLPAGSDYKQISILLGKAFREAGYRVVWDPNWSREKRQW